MNTGFILKVETEEEDEHVKLESNQRRYESSKI